MKNSTIIVAFMLLLCGFVAAQQFPPVELPGPWPFGTEQVRNDAPVDMNDPNDILHEYTAYKASPVVDGEIENDEVWNQIPWTLMESWGFNDWSQSCTLFRDECEPKIWNGWSDLTAWFKLFWDDEHIYLAVKRFDDDYSFVEDSYDNNGNIWQNDAYQVKFDARPTLQFEIEAPGAEIGFGQIFEEEAYNVWMNNFNSNTELDIAVGNCDSGIPSAAGKAIYGTLVQTDSMIIEYFEIAFVRWDEFYPDESQMFSIMANDRDYDTLEGVAQWAQGIWSKTQDKYGSVLWSSQAIPGTKVESDAAAPVDFKLAQNYPNPFNPLTTIEFELATASNVTLAVYDVTGVLVHKLVSHHLDAGTHSVEWNGNTATGKPAASGLYFYQLEAHGATTNHFLVQKMTLMK
ncbi:T9SS type A sorting domain-containing protein [candidate division KSB1 bacterium]|nr:T9SS type A sorting domain-containing protein [candidate division KSB1 bacterium]